MDFAADLYAGTATAYDRFRLGYPPAMLTDLLGRVAVTGRGPMLDLACGTGQLAFALAGSFTSTWAVDQEPDMVRVVAARGGVHAVVASAEDLVAPAASFDLIVIGNAFHRLRRERVAARLFSWARPGGSVALCWSDSPWTGDTDWQRAFAAVVDRWRTRFAAEDRLPAGWASARQSKPDRAVLAEAGFSPVGRFTFEASHQWTVPALAGFVSSTSFLPAPLIGDRMPELEAELADALAPDANGQALVSRTSYAYDLARKPSA